MKAFIAVTFAFLAAIAARAETWTVINLNPAGADESSLYAITGAQQAGFATGSSHAGIWTGTAASFIDLHPAGASSSALNATTGTRQAGSAVFGGVYHAGIWAGSSASFIDLHAFLPTGYKTGNSEAFGIWSDGAATYVGGYAVNSATGESEAILWKLDHAPTVRISGKKKITTTKAKLAIKGTAADIDDNLAKVEVQVGKAKYKMAKGTTTWKFTAHLKPGKNKILARAVDTTGLTSASAKIIVIRATP